MNQGLADDLPCGWLRLNGRGTVVEANAGLQRLIGHPPQALVGLPFDRLLTQASRVLYQSYLQPLLQMHGHIAELALTLAAADGTAVQVLLYAQPLASEAADPGARSLVLVPIQQRKRIESELLRVKRAADQAPGLVFQLLEGRDGRLRFPFVSDSVRTLYGASEAAAAQSAEAVLGHIEPEDRQRLDGERAQAVAAALPWHSVYRVRLAGQTAWRWHELQASARELGRGERLWHGYVTDITERRALEQAVAERDAAAQATRVRGEFLARANHELRTPLNGILGFAQMLVGSDDARRLGPEQRHGLEVILGSGRHLLTLVDRLLDLSRAESGAALGPLKPLNLQAQVRAACERAAPAAQAQNIRLQYQVEPGLRAMADETSLRQVLDNLISNAIKYNQPQGQVRVAAGEPTAEGLALHVIDSGPGLTPEAQAQLFEPFNRLEARHSAVPGTGLGLVISRQLARQMGGDLVCTSTPGQGSCFTVRLASAPAAADHADEPAARSDPPAWAATPAAPVRAAEVLYVEDNEVNVLLMQAVLRQRPGVRLMVAPDAATALELVRHAPPDLLLLDWHLPDARGDELLARLRSEPGMGEVPAVLVTAGMGSSSAPLPGSEAFQACWIKPLDVSRTLRELDQLLAGVALQS